MHTLNHSLSILHIIVRAGATCGQYNELCLPMSNTHEINICTYFAPEEQNNPAITWYTGNDSLWGFLQAFKAAIHAKPYDIIQAHAPITAFLSIIATFLLGVTQKVCPHFVYVIQNSYHNYKFRNKLLMIPIFAFARELVFCSNACFDSYPTYLKWLSRDKKHVVQNCVDTDRVNYSIASLAPLENTHDFTVVSVGRLIKIKNIFTLLNAFHQGALESAKLVFVGEGDLRPKLNETIEALGLQERVKMTGLVGRDDVFRHCAQADVFVSTSRGEGLPVAVIEGMASGCPVILSDIPPHREVAAGVDFIPLVDPDDLAGFSQEIKRFCAMSASERRAIGEKCRALVTDKLSLPAMLQGYETVYAEVIG